MNGTERAYAAHLDEQKAREFIHAWHYEAFNLRLAGRTFYKPDFMVVRGDGCVEFHEVKGHFEEQAKVRIKCAAELHPYFVFQLVRKRAKKDGGGWAIEEVGQFTEGT
jgi:hypothetical protein